MARPMGCKPINWDITELRRLYLDEKMSGAKIGNLLGLKPQSVNSALRRFNIPRRSDTESHSKELHYRWNGGKFLSTSGYYRIYKPDHHRADKRGYVYEHIVIWEEANGRKLRKDEMVHHLNGIKIDNRPLNLLALRKEEHRRWIPALQEHIRQLEAEIKRCSQSVMRLEC